MRRLLMCMAAVLVLCSCRAQDTSSALDYQSRYTYACVLCDIADVRYEMKITFGRSIEIMKPEEISGFTFERADGGAFFVKDDMKIPVSENVAAGMTRFLNCFSLERDCITSVEAGELDGETVSVVSVGQEEVYVVYISRNDVPLKIITPDKLVLTVTELG